MQLYEVLMINAFIAAMFYWIGKVSTKAPDEKEMFERLVQIRFEHSLLKYTKENLNEELNEATKEKIKNA